MMKLMARAMPRRAVVLSVSRRVPTPHDEMDGRKGRDGAVCCWFGGGGREARLRKPNQPCETSTGDTGCAELGCGSEEGAGLVCGAGRAALAAGGACCAGRSSWSLSSEESLN